MAAKELEEKRSLKLGDIFSAVVGCISGDIWSDFPDSAATFEKTLKGKFSRNDY